MHIWCMHSVLMRLPSHLDRRMNEETTGTMVQAFDADEDAMVARPQRAAAPVAAPRENPVAVWELELKQMLSVNMRDEAVHRAAPSGELVRCYVKRVKGFFGSHCSFQMHLETGNVFLLAARRRKKSKTSSYVISQDLDDLKRDTENCLAKVSASPYLAQNDPNGKKVVLQLSVDFSSMLPVLPLRFASNEFAAQGQLCRHRVHAVGKDGRSELQEGLRRRAAVHQLQRLEPAGRGRPAVHARDGSAARVRLAAHGAGRQRQPQQLVGAG